MKLLILGTNYGVIDIINYAKSIGVHTIVTDYLPIEQSPVKRMADEYWMLSTADIDALELKCREEGVTAIQTGANDFNMTIAVELSERLGLPFYCSKKTWHYSINKADFKSVCRKVNAPIPTDYYISEKLTDEELDRIIFPVMVKPIDQAGNNGISYCYNKEDIREGYKLARSVSKSDKVIVERMLHGEEWYASYALANGEVHLLALNAMYSQSGEPKNCYTITTTVSNHVEQFINEINPAIERVLKSVGCREGYCWVQVMLDEDGHFYIIEMGYRLDGDMMFVPYKDLLDFDVIKWIVDYSLGKKNNIKDIPTPPQCRAFTKCACSIMLFTNKGGRIKEINGLDEIKRIPGVSICTTARTEIGGLAVKYKPLGDILFTTDNCDEMCRMIDLVNKKVCIINEDGEDVIIKYTDFDYLKLIYQEGLEGK